MAKYRPRIYQTPFGHVLYALARNQKQLNQITGSRKEKFLDVQADACVSYFEDESNKALCIVQLPSVADKTIVQIHGLLLHEAVHVWQKLKNVMYEDCPSIEFEAYSIQRIALDLFEAFHDSDRAGGVNG
ncbi:hypothetical protein [Shewanella algae]|uniref:hypothetical protein n=1 Tax=Shewanella algae TaxID=38313 RepID=UPI001AAE1638|nr:hypothetical protein [Shewanella algae]MBO2700778.1 hypothetical protein [Shewanella algae]